MATQKTVPANVEYTEEDKERIGTLDGVFNTPKVQIPEVDIDPVFVANVPSPVNPTQPPVRMVRVRIGDEGIEEMSYNAGGRRETYSFAAHEQYVVPDYIAWELEQIGKLWH